MIASTSPLRRALRWLVLAFGITVGVGALLAAPGRVAHADNVLANSAPADGAEVDVSPSSISLTFQSPVGGKNIVEVVCNGATTGVGEPSASADALTLTVAVPTALPKGTCAVAWSVTAPDGTTNGSGSFSFTVVNDAVPTSTPATTPSATTVAPAGGDVVASGDAPSGAPLGLARFVGTTALAILFGSLVLIAVAWPEGVEYILTVRFLRWACIAAIAGVYLSTAGIAAEIDGVSFGSRLLPTDWAHLTDTTAGVAAIARFGFTIAIAWVVVRPERVIDPATQLVALAIPGIAVATLGFSRAGRLEIVGYGAGVVHALAMAIWFGGLVLLAKVVLAGSGDEDLVHAVRGFARISIPALALTLFTGIIQMYRLDWGAIFDTGHGRVLLLKALAAAAMVYVGLHLRQFVRQRMRRADSMSAPLANRLRRAVTIEAVVGLVVLLLTSWLVSLAPARLVDAGSAGPALPAKVTVAKDDLEVVVSFSQRVGPNAVRVEVKKPITGLGDLVIVFTAPEGSNVASVRLSIPLHGRGAAELPIETGVPLNAPGTWTIGVEVSGQDFGTRNVQISA